MTELQINEGNKLIAEFMACREWPEPRHGYVCKFGNVYAMFNTIQQLKFNSSWDWLIPVIDKITSMNEYSKFTSGRRSMFDDGHIFINTKFIGNTWSEVVEFIEWYNESNGNSQS